jgi:hypothetical protein
MRVADPRTDLDKTGHTLTVEDDLACWRAKKLGVQGLTIPHCSL